MRKQKYTIPSSGITERALKSSINAFEGGARNRWRYYRWFYATQTLENMPLGPSGAFIILAEHLYPQHQGWYLVANSSSKTQLCKWDHWRECEGVTYNQDIINKPVSVFERTLGRDPHRWIEVMSSLNPDDWIYQHGSGIGRTNKPGAGRPKKTLDTEPKS